MALQKLLEKWVYKPKSTLFRAMAETDKVDDVASEIADRIRELQISSMLPILGRFMMDVLRHFMSVKKISRFGIVSFPSTSRLLTELEGDRRIKKLYLDRVMYALRFPTVPQQGQYRYEEIITSTEWTRKLIEADQANAEGYRGEGVRVAVIDTTALPVHNSIYHAIGKTTIPLLVTDENGHGIHVASTIGGKLWVDPVLKIPTRGIAPECELVTIKSLGFVIGFGHESDILEAIDLSSKMRCKIVNMSLGSEEVPSNPEDDPQVKIIKKLVEEENMIFCVAAGNSGPSRGTINSPGTAEEAITVGAYSPITGIVAGFSSRGPTPDGRIKPDCVMPGVSIFAPTVGLLDVLNPPKKAMRASSLDGTSMATPHMSGLAALMVQHARRYGVDISQKNVKEALSYYGMPKTNDYGWGIMTWSIWKRYAREVLGI